MFKLRAVLLFLFLLLPSTVFAQFPVDTNEVKTNLLDFHKGASVPKPPSGITRLKVNSSGQVIIVQSDGSTSTMGSGSVSSVGLSLPNIFSVSNSPVTSSGTIAATLASQSQNQFFGSPNGSSGSPSFRAIVAADIPTLNQNTTGSAGSVANALTFGSGLSSGGTYDGATARTVTVSGVTEAMQTLADNTTNNSSTSNHGYLKKLNNDATYYMDGTGNWSIPTGGGGISGSGTASYMPYFSSTNVLADGVIRQVSGNIGINRSPSYAFHVQGETRIVGSSGHGLQLLDDNTNTFISALSSTDTGRDLKIGGLSIDFKVGGIYASKMVLNSSGYLVLDSTARLGVARSPSFPLHVQGETRIVGSSSHGLQLLDDNTNTYISALTSTDTSRNLIIGGESIKLRSGTSYTDTLVLKSDKLVAFEGVTASYPALKRSGTELQIYLADGTSLTSLASSKITITQGSTTTNVSALSITGAYNNAGVTFGGLIKADLTDTTSASGSLLLNLLKASVTQFSVDKSGNVVALGTGIIGSGKLSSPGGYGAFGYSGATGSNIAIQQLNDTTYICGDTIYERVNNSVKGTWGSTALTLDANLKLNTLGNAIYLKEGSNAVMGVATLSSGTVTVSTTAIATGDRVILIHQNSSGIIGVATLGTITNATSFVINSVATDNSDILWIIVKKA